MSDPRDPAPTLTRPAKSKLRIGVYRLAFTALIGACAATGWWHATKPLLPGTHVASEWVAVPPSDLALLADVTSADAYGRPVIHQQIFDETLRVIAAAHEFIVLDLFLFNDHRGALNTDSFAPLRPLSRDLHCGCC
jgi:hypothetical protein